MKIWSWRHAIQKSNLKSTTKFVLLNLSIYMNEQGEGCYPTIQQQMKDTGLSNRVICEHLQNAVDFGFLIKKKHGFSGQKWANNEYVACYPKGSDFNDIFEEKVVTLTTKGSDFNDKKVVTQSHTNSPYNSPYNTCSLFDAFWVLYPRKINKMESKKSYLKAIKKIEPEKLLDCIKRFSKKMEKKEKDYIPHASTWLNQERWNDEIEEQKQYEKKTNEMLSYMRGEQ